MTTASSPRRTLSVFIVLIAVSAVFLDYWEYSRSFYSEPDIWASTLRGASEAPAQYRIGVLKTAEFLTLHTHLAMRHALALFDLIALLIAGFVLCALLARSAVWRSASTIGQWFGAAAFVVLLLYSLLWLTWYQRPETLSIAALLALSLWLSTYRLPIPGAAGTLLTALCLVVLALMLGFIRADVGFTFNVGVALVCLTPLGRSFALSRWMQLVASVLAAGAAAATQLYIMHVLYPHASYGMTPKFQLLLNYRDHIRVVPFALFVVPSAWVVVQVVRRRIRPQPAQAGLLLATLIFTAIWCVLGKIDEVRIFLPFAFALAPLTVEAAMLRVGALENATGARNVC